MRTGDIKRIGRRNYVVLSIGDYEVVLQSLDEMRVLISVPRTKLGGLKHGV